MIKKTRFGSLEQLSKIDGKVVAEIGVFEGEGRNHTHDDWELCTILKGEGEIIIAKAKEKKKHYVKAGDFLAIPPKTGHWMIPSGKGDIFTILITYSPTFLTSL